MQACLQMCIMAGCDFVKAIPGIGIRKAYAQISQLKSFLRVSAAPAFSGCKCLCLVHAASVLFKCSRCCDGISHGAPCTHEGPLPQAVCRPRPAMCQFHHDSSASAGVQQPALQRHQRTSGLRAGLSKGYLGVQTPDGVLSRRPDLRPSTAVACRRPYKSSADDSAAWCTRCSDRCRLGQHAVSWGDAKRRNCAADSLR